MWGPRRIGLFGGTFNPIHNGHLHVADVVREQVHLDRILFIPSGLPPHKQAAVCAPAHHRLAMLQHALSEHPYYEVSDLECRRSETSYTIHTVEQLRRALPEDDLFFMIGADAFSELSSWKEAERLLTLCHFVIVTRPGARFTSCPNLPILNALDRSALWEMDRGARDVYTFTTVEGVRLSFFRTTTRPISAREIRERVAAGQSVRRLLPVRVASYIIENGLYQDRLPSTQVS